MNIPQFKDGIHYNIFHQKSPFAKMSASGLLWTVGGTLSIATDIAWLICDMSHNFQVYHPFILIGLVLAVAIVVFGFILFYTGVKIYNDKQDIKCNTTKERLEELELRISQLENHVTTEVN